MEKETRVRFAPSPTGPLHMGGVRTALYNYLYAKQKGGKFILRIEDTDSQRFVPGAEEYILESLAWCGITPDEGVELSEEGFLKVAEQQSDKNPHAPYRQSQRKAIYREYAEQLVANGYAYYAFDTAEELAKLREEAEAAKQTFIYNYQSRTKLRNSLTLPKEECENLIATSQSWTIRFKIPENQTIKMNDLIRGEMEVDSNTLDDKVLWKAADQLPTYHLANIVDDHLMEITEVIRGAEWLPSLPLHYLLYKAFGWEESMPRFAHLSLLLKPDGKGKLSKRDGDRLGFPVFPLKWVNPENGEISRGYREDGYYPEAFVNLLALLGWNPGTEQELFTLNQLVKAFSLERVIKSGARFNPDKAKWFNQQYLRIQTPIQLAEQLRPMLPKGPSKSTLYLAQVCSLIKERAHFVHEFPQIGKPLFESPTEYEAADVQKFCTEENKSHVGELANLIKESSINTYHTNEKLEETFDAQIIAESVGVEFGEGGIGGGTREVKEKTFQEAEQYKSECCTQIEELLTSYIKSKEWKMGAVMNTLRLYFTGSTKGLGISDLIYFIGKEEALSRIAHGLSATE